MLRGSQTGASQILMCTQFPGDPINMQTWMRICKVVLDSALMADAASSRASLREVGPSAKALVRIGILSTGAAAHCGPLGVGIGGLLLC